jgi:hypothetical protein
MERHPGQGQPDFDDSKLPCYCILFDRYIGLGENGDFKRRDREFKDRKSAAPIFGKQPKTLERMMEDGRLAWIRIGGSVLFHIPTCAALLRRREFWKSCPRCPEY